MALAGKANGANRAANGANMMAKSALRAAKSGVKIGKIGVSSQQNAESIGFAACQQTFFLPPSHEIS